MNYRPPSQSSGKIITSLGSTQIGPRKQFHARYGKQLGFFGSDCPPSSYVIKCEDFGIPQARHRVILLGIRSDLNITPQSLKKNSEKVSLWEVIKGLPKIRSKTSRENDSTDNWMKILQSSEKQNWFNWHWNFV